MEKKQSIRKWVKKLKNRYRLLIINEANFQERTSVSLTIGNIIILFASGLIIFSLIFWGIFTLFPAVKDYTPGYRNTVDGKFKNKIINSMKKIEEDLVISEKRNKALLQIINGEEVTAYNIPYKTDKSRKVEMQINETKADGNRVANAQEKIEKVKELETKENPKPMTEKSSNIEMIDYSGNSIFGYDVIFFKPIEGNLTTNFSSQTPFVVIKSNAEETVKSILDGMIIFSGWTPDDGYIITVQHSNNLISIYKKLSSVYKKTGQVVKAGTPIGLSGSNLGKISSKGLQFEIWQNGNSINPENFINF